MSLTRLARSPARVIFALAIILPLVCGVLAGLARMGLTMPAHAASAAAWHGVLMIPVFFGAAISMERAVAIGRSWTLFSPAAAALAGVVLLAGGPPVIAQVLLVFAAAVAFAGSVLVARIQPALYLRVLALGVVCWGLGNLVWLITANPSAAVPWWLAFLVLTIAAERLELTRMRPLRPVAPHLFRGLVALMLLALVFTLWRPASGMRLFAASLFGLAFWLARYDIARHTVRQRGLTRFIAVCLLTGYGWLATSGLLGLYGALSEGHVWHDAALHALTLGFVFSMVFGHAPIVVPALTKLRLKYHPVLYAPFLALHAALALRVAGGLSGAFWLRQAGSAAAAAALALFFLVMLACVWSGQRAERRSIRHREQAAACARGQAGASRDSKHSG